MAGHCVRLLPARLQPDRRALHREAIMSAASSRSRDRPSVRRVAAPADAAEAVSDPDAAGGHAVNRTTGRLDEEMLAPVRRHLPRGVRRSLPVGAFLIVPGEPCHAFAYNESGLIQSTLL